MPSTVIKDVNYNKERNELTINYISGQVYVYKHVPENVYKVLKASRLKGRYLRFFVKDKYEFEKITD